MLGEKVRILLQKAHKRSEFGLNSLKKVVRKRSYFDKSGSYFIFGSTAVGAVGAVHGVGGGVCSAQQALELQL